MTYPHTPQGTGKRIGTIDERRERFYLRPKHLENIILSVEHVFFRPRGGSTYAATGVPTTRVTLQCARVTPGRRIRAVTARGARYMTCYKPN